MTITDGEWENIDIEYVIVSNWKRLFVKVRDIHAKPLQNLKPKGLSMVLEQYNNRYTSPPFPHSYNLRKFSKMSYNNMNKKHIV